MSGKKVSWNSGEIIYKIGEDSKHAYLLAHGEVEILSKSGTRVGFINQNEVFGEQSILLNTKRTVTAIALQESSALIIPKANLINDYNKSSFLMKAILRSTYIRLTNLSSTLNKDLKSLE